MTNKAEQPTITQEDRSAAVDAIRAVAMNGFVVGCCNMSLCDADEMASYIAKDFARHRTTSLSAQDIYLHKAQIAKWPPAQDGLVEALRRSMVAIDDWLHVYASDMCDEADVQDSRQRIAEAGATLSYIASVQQNNRAALASIEVKS